MLREDEQEFVMQSDGFIDVWVNLVADLEVFTVEPAADAVVLQISVEPINEGVILAGVANEATVIIDGFADEGAHVLDHGVGSANTPEEGFRDVATRAI